MNKLSLACLAALAALVTGCPQNDYTVELTPRGKVIERKLIFYRADGKDTNGVPKYVGFPSNELAAITALYPPGAVKRDGDPYSAKGGFAGGMPGDIGGAGNYQHFTTSLGSAGFYVERFRGNDNLAAQTKARLAAADQLADLVIGWSRAELGREPGYKNLRRFLDGDFRRDLKNLTLYAWAGEISTPFKPQAGEEFIVRFGQYLIEHGYLKIEDAPQLVQIWLSGDDSQTPRFVQKLVAEKLGVPPSGPMPKSLAVLADPAALEKSWDKYLTSSKQNRARLQQWEKDKKTKPDLQKPDLMNELVSTLIWSGSSGEDGHLTVRLTLAAAPDHTNGKWDEARHQVVWESTLEAAESARRLPVFCYANWSQADAAFQQQHFGRVILTGDKLLQYGVWHSALTPAQAGEWDQLLTAFQPGGNWTNQFAPFQFSAGVTTNCSAAEIGKDLVKSALEQKP